MGACPNCHCARTNCVLYRLASTCRLPSHGAQIQLTSLAEAMAGSGDGAQALQNVRDLLDLDGTQATAVVDMQVRRMSAVERTRTHVELDQIRAEIEALRNSQEHARPKTEG